MKLCYTPLGFLWLHPQFPLEADPTRSHTKEPGTSSDRPLTPPLASESDSDPLATRRAGATTSRLITLLESQATGLANAEYDPAVISLQTGMPVPQTSQIRTPTHPGWSTSTLTLLPTTRSATALAPLPPHRLLPGRHDERQHHQGLSLMETGNDTRDIQPDAQTVEPLPSAVRVRSFEL
jgi:hypothetical protein